MPLNQAQVDDARNWLTTNGYGTNGPGGFQLTATNTNDLGMIGGAAQSNGYGNADIAQIFGGPFTASGVGNYLAQNQPTTDIYRTVYDTDTGRTPPGATAPAAPAAGGGGSLTGSGNPYLSGIADDIGRRTQASLGQAFNGIRSNSIGVGGLGGSRQGVAQGVATGQALDSQQGQLANLFGTDYTNTQNRNLQRYGMDQSYALGQGNLQLGNRNTDLNSVQLGANLFNQGNAGYLGQGQGVTNIGNTQQQAPWTVLNSANQSYSPYTGYGQSTTASGQSGGGATGVLGGALAGNVIGRNLGWGTGGGSQGYGWTGYGGTNIF